MNEEQEDVYEEGVWVALTQNLISPHIIPVRVGKDPMVPFGAVGRIICVRPPEGKTSDTHYNIAFHAGWVALGVHGAYLRPARMLEQLALCADGR